MKISATIFAIVLFRLKIDTRFKIMESLLANDLWYHNVISDIDVSYWQCWIYQQYQTDIIWYGTSKSDIIFVIYMCVCVCRFLQSFSNIYIDLIMLSIIASWLILQHELPQNSHLCFILGQGHLSIALSFHLLLTKLTLILPSQLKISTKK